MAPDPSADAPLPPELPPQLPPELPTNGAAAQPAASRWWWVGAFAVAALAGVRAWIGCDDPSPAYCLGRAMGAAGMLLIGALLVQLVWKRPYAPLVAVAVLSGLGLAVDRMQTGQASTATAAYVEQLEQRFESFAADYKEWMAGGGAQMGPQRPREEIVRNRDRARELTERSAGLVSELLDGHELERRLAAAGVRSSERERTLREFSEAKGVVEMFEVATVVNELVGACRQQLELLDAHYGHWTRGFGGGVRFDEDVDEASVARFEAAVARMEAAQRELEQRVGGG
jgi:hypothetical protein